MYGDLGGGYLRDLNGLEEVSGVERRVGTVTATDDGSGSVCRVCAPATTSAGGVTCNKAEEGLSCIPQNLVCTLSAEIHVTN